MINEEIKWIQEMKLSTPTFLPSVNNRFSLKRFSIALSIMAFGLCSNLAADPEAHTHLHSMDEVRSLGWIEDFSFAYDTHTAQRTEVVRYSMQMKKDHVASLQERSLPWTAPTQSANKDWIIGHSHGWPGEPFMEPQPLFGFTITNPDSNKTKMQVILVGSNHAREDPACWALHGLIEFLVSDDLRAAVLRDNIIFYVYPVVNPDGKLFYLSTEHAQLMTVNGNPEIKAAGKTNHNRMWQTEGEFTSIDVAKAAMLKDPQGKADVLFDFHGIPMLTFSFADESAALSNWGRAFSGRGHNFRDSSNPATLRGWASSKNGPAHFSFTPEISNQALMDLLLEGQFIALALLDVVEDNIKDPPQIKNKKGDSVRPPPPSWWAPLSPDHARSPSMQPIEVDAVSWSEDSPFSSAGSYSMEFIESDSAVDFGQPAGLETPTTAMTVSLWAKVTETGSGTKYLMSVYKPSGNQRSWALTQRSNSSEFAVTLSGDGTHDRPQLKRFLSHRWPYDLVLGSSEWRHIAFTFDGSASEVGELKLYLDGERLVPASGMHGFDDSAIHQLFESDASLRLGALDGSQNSSRGFITESAIWNRALEPEEVRWLFENSLREYIYRPD